MPDEPLVERVCPYLRSRHGPDPHPEPGPDNLCLLVSSLHLPESHQRAYCLSGQFTACPRYQRQAGRPIPRYVRGATTVELRPATPVTPMRPLPWRQPWVRTALKWTALTLFVLLFAVLWWWRLQQVPPFVVEREPVPTPAVLATPTLPPVYLPPTAGPPEW